MAKAQVNFDSLGGVSVNPVTVAAGTLERYATVDISIDTSKDYVVWCALLQNDATYRAGSYKIIKGAVSAVENTSAVSDAFYMDAEIVSTTTLRLTQKGQLAGTPIRYGLIQLD